MVKIKHGHTGSKSGKHYMSPTYISWVSMKQRCNNVKHNAYSKYGLVGIKACKSWNDSFENFLSDMGERPEGKTLDRIDGKQGYFKENCRWSTQKEQMRNIKCNQYVIYNGQKKLSQEWEKIYNVSRIWWKLKNGWTMDMIVNTKKGYKKPVYDKDIKKDLSRYDQIKDLKKRGFWRSSIGKYYNISPEWVRQIIAKK